MATKIVEEKENVAVSEEKVYRMIIREVTTKDSKKTYKSYKIVDEDNRGRLVDCVMCKTISGVMLEELSVCNKAKVTGDITINTTGYEFPKAFVRQITSVEKIS